MTHLFTRIRRRFFAADIPKVDETNTKAREVDAMGQHLLAQWQREEDVRRFNRTGNFVEGWLSPEPRRRGDER